MNRKHFWMPTIKISMVLFGQNAFIKIPVPFVFYVNPMPIYVNPAPVYVKEWVVNAHGAPLIRAIRPTRFMFYKKRPTIKSSDD
jgi:hypothetical protein